MGKTIQIGSRKIGPSQSVFVIAEAGVNHNGDLALAKKLIDAAVVAGADAVKFQTFTAELLVTKSAPQADYQTKNTGKAESQFDMLKRLELPRSWHADLQSYCQKKGIIFLSTPFSEDDADFLDSIDIPAFKIPSGEITNLPYLGHIARKKKPVILSTGMATLEEVLEAVEAIRAAGNEQVVILHSTSNYPPTPGSLNLRAIATVQTALEKYDIPVGYSDNGSPGVLADTLAVALGACLIEKHFTLNKNLPGPDHAASLDPKELTTLVEEIRLAETMLGHGKKMPAEEEKAIAAIARKSIIARRAIAKGAIITAEDLIMKRPGSGIPPNRQHEVVGRRANKTIAEDTLIAFEDLYAE